LLAMNKEMYAPLLTGADMSGETLLALDSSGLKELGVRNKEDRECIRKKLKELRSLSEREHKEAKKRDKMLKKQQQVNNNKR